MRVRCAGIVFAQTRSVTLLRKRSECGWARPAADASRTQRADVGIGPYEKVGTCTTL